MKQWRINDRKMAAEMFKQVTRVLTKDAYVKPESVQVLIDLARESAKVTKPVNVVGSRRLQFFRQSQERVGHRKIVSGSVAVKPGTRNESTAADR